MPPCMLNWGPPCCCCAYIMLCACQASAGVSAEMRFGWARSCYRRLEEWWRWRTWYMAACCGLAYIACCCMAAMACI